MGWGNKLKNLLPAAPDTGAPIDATIISSVLAPIGWDPETKRNQIILMKRTMTVGFHKGQVSFPGGMKEPQDATLLDTALRETEEEIGLHRNDVVPLGGLTPVRTRNEVVIYPYVGTLIFPYDFLPSPTEVDRLLFLPVDRLLEEGLKAVHVQVGDLKVKSEGIMLEGELVWGATARILSELRDFLSKLSLTGPV